MQSKKEIENAKHEHESQLAFDALQAHEKTYPAMMREFDKLDAECIKLARELAALQLAESPRAEALHGELRLARMIRDGFRYRWNRTRDELTANLERVNEQELQPFRSWILTQARLLTNKIETKHPRVYIDAEGLRRQIKGETNAPAVKFVRDSLFAGAKPRSLGVQAHLNGDYTWFAKFRDSKIKMGATWCATKPASFACVALRATVRRVAAE
ncbi:MAG: hypothetical protein LAP85_29225 [Acidobacteriia bacterium]|nr:hypothetical protein [Terriglobia bacterium]